MISWSLLTPDSSLELKAKKITGRSSPRVRPPDQRQLHAGPTENKSPIIKSSQDQDLRRRSSFWCIPTTHGHIIKSSIRFLVTSLNRKQNLYQGLEKGPPYVISEETPKNTQCTLYALNKRIKMFKVRKFWQSDFSR